MRSLHKKQARYTEGVNYGVTVKREIARLSMMVLNIEGGVSGEIYLALSSVGWKSEEESVVPTSLKLASLRQSSLRLGTQTEDLSWWIRLIVGWVTCFFKALYSTLPLYSCCIKQKKCERVKASLLSGERYWPKAHTVLGKGMLRKDT